MGTTSKGILTPINGTVGPVVGSTWRGKEYLKSRPKKSSKPPTEKQLMQQAKFKLVGKFVKQLVSLVSRSFENPAAKTSGFNRAFAHAITEALTGSYPAYGIDYTKTQVSEGPLRNPNTPASTAAGAGMVKFTWVANSGSMANDDDRCIGVIYCPELNSATFTDFNSGAFRTAGSHEEDASQYVGKTVHTWLLFKATNAEVYSTSAYLGELVVS